MKSLQTNHLQLFEMIYELFPDTVVVCHHEKLFTSPSIMMIMMISQKVALRLFARRGRISPPPPSEINSDGSTPTSSRSAKRPGRLTDFQITRLQLFEIIDELFDDTVVICHHEKLFTSPSIIGRFLFKCRFKGVCCLRPISWPPHHQRNRQFRPDPFNQKGCPAVPCPALHILSFPQFIPHPGIADRNNHVPVMLHIV